MTCCHEEAVAPFVPVELRDPSTSQSQSQSQVPVQEDSDDDDMSDDDGDDPEWVDTLEVDDFVAVAGEDDVWVAQVKEKVHFLSEDKTDLKTGVHFQKGCKVLTIWWYQLAAVDQGPSSATRMYQAIREPALLFSHLVLCLLEVTPAKTSRGKTIHGTVSVDATSLAAAQECTIGM